MKMTKGQGISFFVLIVAFSIYSVFLFNLPVEKRIVFWLGYMFAAYAVCVMIGTLMKFFMKQSEGRQFLNIPIVVVSWTYLGIQLYMSYKEVMVPTLPYMTQLVVNLVYALGATALIMILAAAGGRTAKNEQRVAEKVLFIKSLENDLSMIESKDAELSRKLEKLIEEVSFSDPMSHSALAGIEGKIRDKVTDLTMSEDVAGSITLCDDITKLLKNRNQQCITLKGVRDEVKEPEAKGGGTIALTGLAVAYAIALIALAIVFYIVPETKYKDACALMTAEKYDEAMVAFLEIANYKDSTQKIEEIQIAKLDIKYAEALELMQEEKYDEAVAAFVELNGHKDSEAKIEEIKSIATEELYTRAEQAFTDGDYETALGLYRQVAPYKDSNDKMVDINNRLSEDTIIYLGTYKGEPIAWRIVERYGFNKMLIIADQPIRNLPISDDITYTSFADSEIAKWLNGDFLTGFSAEDMSQIIPEDGLNVFILSEDDVKRLTSFGADLTAEEDWWLRSESDTGFRYATEDGVVEEAGDLHFRDKGVRPAIWIDLR